MVGISQDGVEVGQPNQVMTLGTAWRLHHRGRVLALEEVCLNSQVFLILTLAEMDKRVDQPLQRHEMAHMMRVDFSNEPQLHVVIPRATCLTE